MERKFGNSFWDSLQLTEKCLLKIISFQVYTGIFHSLFSGCIPAAKSHYRNPGLFHMKKVFALCQDLNGGGKRIPYPSAAIHLGRHSVEDLSPVLISLTKPDPITID